MVAATAGGLGLAHRGGWPTWLIVSTAGLALALRAPSHRPALRMAFQLAAAGASGQAIAVSAYRGAAGLGLTTGLIVSSLLLAAVGERRSSPHLARFAEVIELFAAAAVVPAVCLGLDLFGQFG